MHSPQDSEDWLGLSDQRLPIDKALSWAGRPDCGGVVCFSGNARDHSEGRPEVSVLAYEAYEEQAVPRLAAIAFEARARWPEIGRLVMLHRTGEVPVGEAAVVVVASSPHRAEAFDAARFCIDTLKATVPVWKHETWNGGSEWGLDAQHITEVERIT